MTCPQSWKPLGAFELSINGSYLLPGSSEAEIKGRYTLLFDSTLRINSAVSPKPNRGRFTRRRFTDLISPRNKFRPPVNVIPFRHGQSCRISHPWAHSDQYSQFQFLWTHHPWGRKAANPRLDPCPSYDAVSHPWAHFDHPLEFEVVSAAWDPSPSLDVYGNVIRSSPKAPLPQLVKRPLPENNFLNSLIHSSHMTPQSSSSIHLTRFKVGSHPPVGGGGK